MQAFDVNIYINIYPKWLTESLTEIVAQFVMLLALDVLVKNRKE